MTQTLTASAHVKPPVPPDQFEYKQLKQGEFWRHIPAYAEVDEATFLDHLWQQRQSVKTAEELLETIRGVCTSEFYEDAEEGFRRAPMAVRVSPYAIALIDWSDPIGDPIRRQFIPLASALLRFRFPPTHDLIHDFWLHAIYFTLFAYGFLAGTDAGWWREAARLRGRSTALGRSGLRYRPPFRALGRSGGAPWRTDRRTARTRWTRGSRRSRRAAYAGNWRRAPTWYAGRSSGTWQVAAPRGSRA